MISAENITKSFGNNILFEGVNFRINQRERIGIVGRNGHGKTTLFKLVTGDEKPDGGIIIIPKNYRIGYVHQQLEFTSDTILKEGMTGLPRYERDHYWKVEKILAGLGFSVKDMSRRPEEFSGGYQVRLNLAKVIVSEPDLLLLDEPTNYLDITSIRWIERFLAKWPRELMLISHNRSFMDNSVTHILGIHRKKIRKIQGNTGKYYAQIAQDEEVIEKTRINDEKRNKETRLFISRFRAKARLANLVQSRIKTLNKMDKKEKLEEQKNLEFSFRSKPFRGKYILHTRDLSFAYNNKLPIIDGFDITIKSGERLCVIGQNGRGKTTLLKLLAGELMPDRGEISYNPSLTKGFFEQTNVKSLIDRNTVEEEILYSNPDIDRQAARNICGAMMFEGDSALKKIGVLSGGEKSRVMIGKLLSVPVNILILDEPTNHLDMESSDALLAALDNFKGTLIMVTHNEMFLHALADRLIVFQNDAIDIIEGTYQNFLESWGWEKESANEAMVEADSEKEESHKKNKKKLRKKRSELIVLRSMKLKPVKLKIKNVENDIEAIDKKLAALNLEILEASKLKDGKKISDLSRIIYDCNKAMDKLYDKLEELTDTFDELNGKFEKEP